ncbi:MAG: hypothetical protein KC620_05660 [Myxococcales bacterium]|nr:hypothetical protein [Myxococcales bacterium]
MRSHLARWVLIGALGTAWGCAECEEDYDCPGTQVCDRERGVCEAFVCGVDADCAPGQRCTENRCKPTEAAPPAERPDALVITPAE